MCPICQGIAPLFLVELLLNLFELGFAPSFEPTLPELPYSVEE